MPDLLAALAADDTAIVVVIVVARFRDSPLKVTSYADFGRRLKRGFA